MELTPAEGRVLGCLVEKRVLTPQQYPLTDNALVAACNQTTSRDPVVAYDVPTVRLAVRSLRERGLVRTTHRTGERSDKHEHRTGEVLGLDPAEVALFAVLLLRGPQTPGELRARTERMHAFGTVEDVTRVLDELADRDEPLAVRLERQPGRKEARYAAAVVPRDEQEPSPANAAATPAYFDNTGRDDVVAGGVKMVPVSTRHGDYRVWTKRTGNNPATKVLLLHGGPGATHEYLTAFDSFLPGAGVEFYYYDQLGSGHSDRPGHDDLWDVDRFVDEVEQVRRALALTSDDFYLLGHSWGGILAVEYALRHQQHLKGLVISNMMASIPAYNAYARDVLMPAMDQDALAEIQRLEATGETEDPRYMALLREHHYRDHVLRLPEWPEPVARSFANINPEIYVPMQGPSELGASGKLAQWDRTADLHRIAVRTLVVGGAHDTMDPEHLRWMAEQMPDATYLHCPRGSHLAMYDDQRTYMAGLLAFLAG